MLLAALGIYYIQANNKNYKEESIAQYNDILTRHIKLNKMTANDRSIPLFVSKTPLASENDMLVRFSRQENPASDWNE